MDNHTTKAFTSPKNDLSSLLKSKKIEVTKTTPIYNRILWSLLQCAFLFFGFLSHKKRRILRNPHLGENCQNKTTSRQTSFGIPMRWSQLGSECHNKTTSRQSKNPPDGVQKSHPLWIIHAQYEQRPQLGYKKIRPNLEKNVKIKQLLVQ